MKTTLKYLTGVVAAIFILLALTVISIGILFATPKGQNLLLGFVNDQIPGSITLAKMHLSPWKSKIELHGLEIKDPHLEKVAAVEKILIRLDLSRLLDHEIIVKDFQVIAPHLNLVQDSDTGFNLTACFVDSDNRPESTGSPATTGPPLPVNIIVDQFILERGSLVLDLEAEKRLLKIDGISLAGSGNLADRTARLTLLTKVLSLSLNQGETFRADHLNLGLTVDNNTLSDIDFSIFSAPGNIVVKGSVANFMTTPRAALSMDLMADLEKISTTFAIPVAMAGTLKAAAKLTGTPMDPEIHLVALSNGGKIASTVFARTDLRCQLKNRKLTLEKLTASIDGSQVSAEAGVDLTQVFPHGFTGPFMAEEILASLHLKAANAGYQDSPRGDGEITLAFSNDQLDIKAFHLNFLDSNLTLAGSVKPMADHRLLSPEQIQTDLEFSSTRIILENFLERFLPKETLDKGIIKGEFAVTGSVKGTLGNPTAFLSLFGKEIQPVAQVKPGLKDQADPAIKPIQAQLQLHLKERMLTLEQFLASLEGGQVAARGKMNLTRAFPHGFFDKAAVEKISGNLEISADDFEPQTILEAFDVTDVHGRYSFDATLTGSLDHPEATLVLRATDAGYKKFPRSDLAMDLAFLTDHLEIKKVTLKNPDGDLTLEGRIRVMENGTVLAPEKISGNLEISAGDFKPQTILEAFDVTDVHGRYSFDATLTGSLDHPEATLVLRATDAGYKKFSRADLAMDLAFLTDHLEIKKVTLAAPDADLTLEGRIRVMENNRFLAPEKMTVKADMTVRQSNLQRFFDLAEKTDVKGSVTATVQASGSLEQKIEINATGKIPARTAQLFTGKINSVEGELDLQVNALVGQDIKNSVVTGRIELDNIAMIVEETGQKLHRINGVILADREMIQAQEITGMLDTGKFTLSGNMGLVDFSPDRFKLQLRGIDLPLVMPDSMNALFQTDLVLEGTVKEASLGGTITLSSGEWTADFNLEKTALEKILGTSPRPSSSVSRSDNPVDAIALDLIVRTDAPFSISNNLAYLSVTPNLKIGGTLGRPAVTGRATLVPGTITYQGREFELTTGTVDFIDPYAIVPMLDILAEHQIRDRQIILKLTGTPDNLILVLTSQPQEEHGDILSLLLTGKTTNELINAEGGTTTSPAALVAGLAASSFADRLKKNVGLDILEVELGQNGSDSSLSDVNLTVGKEITDKITVAYGMETKEGEMIQKTSTDYKLSDRFTVSGFQNTEGHYGAEIRYRLEFR